MSVDVIKLHYRHGKGKFDHMEPLFVSNGPETIYIDNSADIKIGKGVNLSREVMILTHEHDHSRDVPVGGAPVKGIPLEIGDDVFIGARAIICAQVAKIGTGAVIGAGSVLTKDVGEYEIWAGNPARFIKHRS